MDAIRERPEPPSSGYEWQVDPDCRVLPPDTTKRCRAHRGPGYGHEHCQQPAIAELTRTPASRAGPRDWWSYCAEHLYNYRRMVEGGQVWAWKWKGGDGD